MVAHGNPQAKYVMHTGSFLQGVLKVHKYIYTYKILTYDKCCLRNCVKKTLKNGANQYTLEFAEVLMSDQFKYTSSSKFEYIHK